MNSINRLLAVLPEGGWERLVCDALWQSAVIAAIGLFVARFLVRHAAPRAWMLMLTATACIIVPLASAASRSAGWTVLPRVEAAAINKEGEQGSMGGGEITIWEPPMNLSFPAEVTSTESATLAPTEDAIELTATELEPTVTPGAPITATAPILPFSQSPILASSTASGPRINWLRTLAIVWLTASALLALRLVLSALTVRKILRHAKPCNDGRLHSAAAAAAARVGLRNAPPVLVSDRIESPMVLALGQPRLLVPHRSPLAPREGTRKDALSTLTSEDANSHANISRSDMTTFGINWTAAFTHELAHVARRDGWSRLWMELVAIALPLQPLVWLVRRKFHLACEEACDDLSVAAGSDPVDLAETLTAWLGRRTPKPATAIGMSSTKSRVLRLLAMREKPSAKVPKAGRWLSIPAMLLLISGLAVAQVPSGANGNPATTEPSAKSQTDSSIEPTTPAPAKAKKLRILAESNSDEFPEHLVESALARDPEIAKLAEEIASRQAAIDRQAAADATPDNNVVVGELKAKLSEARKHYDAKKAEVRPIIIELLKQEFGPANRRSQLLPPQSTSAAERPLNVSRELIEKNIREKEEAIVELEEQLKEQTKAVLAPQVDGVVRRLREQIAEVRKEIALRRNELAKLARTEQPNERGYEGPSIGAYTIEPPDILLIDAIQLTPKEPAKIAPLDKVQIEVTGTLPGQDIKGTFRVDSTGEVVLGPAYGAVKIKGLTRRQAQAAIDRHLCDMLADPVVALTIDESRVTQEIGGEHLVAPDGNVNLGTYGLVYIAGMTLPEARAAIEKKLSEHFESPRISVDVFAYNSKVYYVIVQAAEANGGDSIYRFPVTGNETVLDAISQIKGLSQVASKNIWIARPSPNGQDQTLSVKWDQIVAGGGTNTNYQILPGDRIFVAGSATKRDIRFAPGKIRVELLDTDDPNTWRWKLFIPRGVRYGWKIAYDDIPKLTPPREGTSHIMSGYSNEPYYATDNEVLVTAKLLKLENGNWRMSVSSRINSDSGEPTWQMSGTSAEIPAESLKWRGSVGSTDGQTLGDHGNLLIDAKDQIILLQSRPCQKQPDGSYLPAEGTAPGFMIWMEKWGEELSPDSKPQTTPPATPQTYGLPKPPIPPTDLQGGHLAKATAPEVIESNTPMELNGIPVSPAPKPVAPPQRAGIYFVIVKGVQGRGDNIGRFSLEGDDTVLDALSQVEGLTQLRDVRVWILRQNGDDQTIDVDWDAISGKTGDKAPPKLQPGDRVFITGGRLEAPEKAAPPKSDGKSSDSSTKGKSYFVVFRYTNGSGTIPRDEVHEFAWSDKTTVGAAVYIAGQHAYVGAGAAFEIERKDKSQPNHTKHLHVGSDLAADDIWKHRIEPGDRLVISGLGVHPSRLLGSKAF